MATKRHIDSIRHPRTKPVAAAQPAARATVSDPVAAPSPELAPADRFESLFPQPTVSISRPPAWVWVLLVLVLVAGLGFLGYNLANGKINSWLTASEPTPTATPTPTPSATATPTTTPTATPTPTPSPTPTPIDKASISLRVLNGTGTSGAAAAAADKLTTAGFKVRTTGNAKSQGYTKTIIYYASGKQDQAAAVQSALSGYPSDLQQSDSLAAPDDVLVVVGPKG